MKNNLINALDGVRGGADIYSYKLASELRTVQKLHPEYINICKPQAYKGDGTDQTPYFGAIATAAGIKYLDEINVFNSPVAQQAQKEYCTNNHAPHFAPVDGICFRCKKDIYARMDNGTFVTGISVRRAANELVLYCPHCGRSYDD